MVDLSIFLGGIRIHNWERLYNSIEQSISNRTWEMVVCGPENHPTLPQKKNFKFIQDFGCVTRAYQIAALNCEGNYITYAADDGWYYPQKLDFCMDLIQRQFEKFVLVTKYKEGGKIYPSASYYLHYHDDVRLSSYGSDVLLFNVAFFPRNYFYELGGFDCQFEALPMALCDLGVRTHRDSDVKIRFLEDEIFECEQITGTAPEHLPIHISQTTRDQPLYKKLYNSEDGRTRIKIDINNYKNCSEIWSERFGTEKRLPKY